MEEDTLEGAEVLGITDFKILRLLAENFWEGFQVALDNKAELTEAGKRKIAVICAEKFIKDLRGDHAPGYFSFLARECAFLFEFLPEETASELASATMDFYVSSIKRGQLIDLLGIDDFLKLLKVNEFGAEIDATLLEKWKFILMHLPAEFWDDVLSAADATKKIMPTVQIDIRTYHELGAPPRPVLDKLQKVIVTVAEGMVKNGGAKALARLKKMFETDESGVVIKEVFRAVDEADEAQKVRSAIRSELLKQGLMTSSEAEQEGPLPIRYPKSTDAMRAARAPTTFTSGGIFESVAYGEALLRDPEPELQQYLLVVLKEIVQTYFPHTKVTDELIAAILEMRQVILLLRKKNVNLDDLSAAQKRQIFAPLGLDENLKPVKELGIAPKLLALVAGDEEQ